MGEIITFYSYKGGTGRTMAMANVAWILAAAGHRVLMVDWDLEAPGLHRYFHPFLRDKELVTSTGVMDIVLDFTVQAMTPPSGTDNQPTWYLPYADVLRHAVSIDWDFGKGQLDLLPAGRQNAAYATRVNSFNWDNFYERLGGGTFLEALRASMLREYEYVLIDSRTGVSDTSGICTVQMPDKIVVCFTLNRQSIEGAASVAQSIVETRARSGRPDTKVFPVPTRVEKAETLRLDAARTASRVRFEGLLWHVPAESRLRYWDDSEVVYQPFYAYEEVLSTFGDASPMVGSLLHTMQGLAARLVGVPELAWQAPGAEKRAEVLSQYGWATPVPTPKVKVPNPIAFTRGFESAPTEESQPRRSNAADPSTYSFFVSYAKIDAGDAGRRYLARFIRDLGELVRQYSGREARPFFDLDSMRPGDLWEDVHLDALASSRAAVCLLSPAYIHSEYCGREFAALRLNDVPIFPVLWMPVREPLPAALQERMIAAPRYASVGRSGLQALLRFERFDDVYQEILVALAKQLANAPTPQRRAPVRFDSMPNAFADDRAQPVIGTQVLVACLAPTTVRAGSLLLVESVAPSEWSWRPFGSARVSELVERAAAEEGFAVDRASPARTFVDEMLHRTARMGLIVAGNVDPTVGEAAMLRKVNEMIGDALSVVVVEAGTPSPESQATYKEMLPNWSSRGLPRASNEEELVNVIRRELVRMRSHALRQISAAHPPSAEAPLPKISP